MLKGQDASHVQWGNSFSEDRFEGEQFDYNSFKKEMAKEIDVLEDELMGIELKL
jgi:hypothetical protein